jgi:hypothetical protein
MATSEIVVLRGGVSVMLSAFRLALELEERGFSLRAVGDDVLEVQPCKQLTGEDCRLIRAYKHELLRIVRYEVPEPVA